MSIAPLAPRGGGLRCNRPVVRRARPLMGTFVGITARGDDQDFVETVIRDVFREMERLEGILSEWSPSSAVSRVNDAAGSRPTVVPDELIEVLDVAAHVARVTGGAFDVTWGALAPLWRLDADDFRPPSPDAVADRRRFVDYRDVVLDVPRRTVWLRRQGMRLGLGGIAKAFIAERGADFAVARGVPDVLVDAGGDIVARGRNGERPWSVAVRHPRSRGAPLATVELRDETLVTSGDYEQFVEVDGKRLHHLLDPRTGWPASGCTSATVIAPRGALADALATGVFVTGLPGLDFVSAERGAVAMVVGGDGVARFSAGAAARFRPGRPLRRARGRRLAARR